MTVADQSGTTGSFIRVSLKPGIDPLIGVVRAAPTPEYLKRAAQRLRRLVVEPHAGCQTSDALFGRVSSKL